MHLKGAIFINNKVLVKLIVPEIDCIYRVYLPVNKKIGNIILLLNKTIAEFTNNELEISNKNVLFNVATGQQYMSDVLLVETDIRNGTQLVLLSN